MYAIDRTLSAERPPQPSDISAELRSIDDTLSNARFLEVCGQEERFAFTSVAKGSTRAFRIVNARSETAEGVTINDNFNIRLERLHYTETFPDIKQDKVKAGLGSQQVVTLLRGQCHTSNRLSECGFLQSCEAR